jgi:methyltransferase (TIGR00027 family)
MAISVTSIFCAFLRGFHSYYDSYKICDDSFALQIIPEERIQLIRKGFTSAIPNVSEQRSNKEIDAIISSIIKNIPTTAQVLSRTYYCEKELELFLEKGNSQYIILGAGLDTYSLRYNNSLPIKIFEIDQEDTQCFKKEQIYRIKKELPKNTEYICADLSNTKLPDVLCKSSFDQNKSVLVSALGLIMYLSIDSINDLFKSLSKICLAGSLIVFDYFDDSTFDETKSSEDFKKWIKQGKLTGEQFRSCLSYDDLVSIANTNSFTVKAHLSPDEIQGKYFPENEAIYKACEHVHFVTLEKL